MSKDLGEKVEEKKTREITARNVEWGWGGQILGPFTRYTSDTPHHKNFLLIARLIVKTETVRGFTLIHTLEIRAIK